MTSPTTMDRSYRRGAIMGLTMAEAFILIAFALLLLFAFWKWEREREETPEVKVFRELPYDQRQMLLAASKDGSIEAFIKLQENGFDFKTPASLENPREKWRFIDKDELRRLLDAASELPPDMQRDLADMVENQDSGKILREMAILEELIASGKEIADLVASTEIAQSIQDAGMSPKDILATANIIKTLEQSDRTLEDLISASEEFLRLQQMGQTLEDISRRITQAENQQTQMVSALNAALGDLVSSVGGRIDENGAIILPDTVLFEQGSATVTRVLRKFLAEACQPWIATLMRSGVDIAEIKIEGHASSEWSSGSSPQQAYLGNLDLSQRRSQAVLRVCLDLIDDEDVINWARDHMIAVGYSSVRPIMRNGQEDRVASRRVVLSAVPNKQGLIDQIENEAKSASGGD